MDPKMIEMNNLRVLNDYLNQTLEVLTRTPRAAHSAPMGYSPFTPYASPVPAGTDVVWGQNPSWGQSPAWSQSPSWAQSPWGQGPWGQSSWGQAPWAFSGTPFPGTPYPQAPYAGAPFTPPTTPWGAYPQSGPAYDPTYAQRSFTPPGFGPYYYGWQQPVYGFSPMVEAQRQAQVTQALAAKHSVLEAICRACGIPV